MPRMRRTRAQSARRSIPTPLLVALLALLPLLAVPALRAAEPPAPGMQEGYAALEANDLPRAAKAFQAVVERQPDNAEAWFRLGLAQREMRQYDAAAAALGKALDKGYAPQLVNTSLAIVYAAKEDRDRAFEYLERAVKAGAQPAMLKSHPGLASLRGDPRFQRLLSAADQAAHPCESDPRYRAFDFWGGEWEVYAGSQLVGSNRVERIERGCALLENWSGAGGGSGKSLNYFDAADGKWRQDWVDDGGSVIHYAGELRDGAMRMTGESRSAKGARQLARGTWTPRPDGTVRQLLETSADGGKSWQVGFDGVYVKKGSAPPAAH
jgi:tetratricopeptide (TPR) repeat protein